MKLQFVTHLIRWGLLDHRTLQLALLVEKHLLHLKRYEGILHINQHMHELCTYIQQLNQYESSDEEVSFTFNTLISRVDFKKIVHYIGTVFESQKAKMSYGMNYNMLTKISTFVNFTCI